MTKKVIELASEAGVSSKQLIETAVRLGISAKTPASILSDADAKKVLAEFSDKKEAKSRPAFGRPIVDEKFLANKRRTPVGKPIVNEDVLEGRGKEKAEPEKEAPAAGKPAAKKAAAAKKPAAAKAKPEEKPAAPAPEEKPAAAKKPAAKKAAAPQEKPEEKPAAPAAKEKPAEVKKPAAEQEKPAAAKAPETPAPKAKPAEEKKPETAASKQAASDGKKTAKDDTAQTKSTPKSAAVKAPAAESKPEKKEPEIKLADSEVIRTPKIKIIRHAEDVKREDQQRAKAAKAAREQRMQNAGRNAGGQEGRRPRKPGEAKGNAPQGGRKPARTGEGAAPFNNNNRRQRPARPGDAAPSRMPQGETGKKGRRGGAHESGRDKFEKFEAKSLEKKERKRYSNRKPEAEQVVEEEVLPEGTFKIDVPITIAGFCEQTEVSVSKVIMALMKLGIMANINQNIDEETLMVLAEDLGINVVIGNVEETVEEEGIENFVDDEKDLVPRAPIITVMGHVDHGKTSLLDAIRKTNVTASESGGITQHIGASEVMINGRRIVFLDTPGHEAFTAMRARGAHVTDIAVLVVAADDGVMPQTIESISHAKAANVPIIVAINKMDKPGANPDRVMKELADQGVLVEDWGGDVISVPVSAKTGTGIQDLLEMILLQADVLELRANPDRLAMGSVVEARLDKAKGPVATLLVLNGTLHAGQSVVAGTCSGRIRLMTDEKGRKLAKAGPATAVEILGLTDVPQAGDNFNAVSDDKTAREIAARRQEKLREETMTKNASMSLEKLFSQIQEGEVKELNLIIKADVQGSVGAIISSLEKLNTDDVKVRIIHSGVGTVNESDVMLAESANAIIIGFNVRPSAAVTSQAEQSGVEIRLYRVIYDALNDVEAAMKGMLDPEVKEEVLGQAQVRDTFKVPGVGIIAGAYITNGKVVRNAEIRLVRDGIVIHEGKISSLKRFKDDAKEVAQGYECGIGIEDYNDIKVDDVIECFHMVEVERNL